jgi:hypothetical protein
MGSPEHSLHLAVAAPATSPSVEQPYLCRDTPQETIPVPCLTSCDLAISSPRGSCKDFRTACFAFLCSPPPVWSFHVETTSERSTGWRGTCLVALPLERGSIIAGSHFLGFALAEDLLRKQSCMKPKPNFASPIYQETPTYMPQCLETVFAIEGGTHGLRIACVAIPGCFQ